MKKMRKFTILLLALMTVLMMSQAAFAADGTFTFNGEEITASDLSGGLGNMQPGDSLDLTFVYKNASSEDTEWYLSNTIIKTLEEGSRATNGGYTYTLTNHGVETGEVEIYNSDRVGGDGTTGGTGLEQVNSVIKGDGDEEYIYIDKLAPGQSGMTILHVELDGESQANYYENTDGELLVSYAVEIVGTEDVIKYVKTGDENNLLLPAVAFVASLLLLILAVLSFRKDRKDGDEA